MSFSPMWYSARSKLMIGILAVGLSIEVSNLCSKFIPITFFSKTDYSIIIGVAATFTYIITNEIMKCLCKGCEPPGEAGYPLEKESSAVWQNDY